MPAGEERDQSADLRDRAADQRDRAADQRDAAADQRDQASRRRDLAAEQSEARVDPGSTTDDLNRSASKRREADADRRSAGQDRRAGSSDRTQAELDRDASQADRRAAAKEREVASVDGLTGVYLRGAGIAELQREIARVRRSEQPLVLAFVDVDRLKSINDAGGHAAGDRMLVRVADTFRSRLRSYDLIVRYGGDEFVCVMSGLGLADARTRFALVNAALAEGPEGGSVTVGLAELQPDDLPEDLIGRADAALYRARQQH